MKSKKGLVLSILLGCFIIGVSIPLFMTKHTKVKADTITDLTNTKWILNTTFSRVPSGITWDDLDDTSEGYNINFTSNDTNYTVMTFRGHYIADAGINYYYPNIPYNQTLVWDENNNTWLNQEYRTITITGGAAATNTRLISWLQNNATQQQIITGTQISHRYWSIATGFRMQIGEIYSDNDIEYTVLFNEQRRSFDETTQTGLVFRGPTNDDNTCYMWAINGTGINLLYRSEDDRFLTACWFEFTPGDYIDTDLYDFMSLIGHWFDDDQAYLCGTSQGYAEGIEQGRALGQADGVEYTGLVTGIFNGLGNLLSIQVFPNITIGLLLGLPLLLGALIIILKILRG